MAERISEKTIGRLSLYRRLLTDNVEPERRFVFSHELAALVGVTPSQVRRDLMVTGCYGNPSRGYRITEVVDAIGGIVDDSDRQNVALVGMGKLGGALVGYFRGRRPNLEIVAAFDVAAAKIGRVYSGVLCYHLDALSEVVAERGIHTGILAVPGGAAQAVADRMVSAGVLGIVNFAPAPLRVPETVYVETIDLAVALERAGFYGRQNAEAAGKAAG